MYRITTPKCLALGVAIFFLLPSNQSYSQEHSFQSVNFTDPLMRHRDFLLFIEPIKNPLAARDSVFVVIPGLAGQCHSFIPKNIVGLSTSGNKGSGRSPRGGRARRYCPRRADLPVQCGSYLPPRSAAASRDGCSSRFVSPVLSPARISVSSSLLERATMSQKSSLPQPTQSVSRVLTADTSREVSPGAGGG